MEHKDLTPKQIELIQARQKYLEEEILGSDPEGKEYILESQGSMEAFYKKNLWDYLNLSEFCDSEPRGEVLGVFEEGDEQ
jgi:hypothetical protein